MSSTLPQVPPQIRHLTTEQSRHLNLIVPPSARKTCVTCLGEREFLWYTKDRDPESLDTYTCSCDDQFLLYRRFLHCGVNLTYQRLGWDDFTYIPSDAVEFAGDYLEHSDRYVSAGMGVLLWGDRGNGKTMLSMLMAKRLIAQGMDCYANTFAGLIDAFAEGWRGKEERQWFNRRVRNAEVLFVDDVGRERNKGTGTVGESALEEVLRYRASQSMPTVITTNENPENFANGYGGHVMSLLSERSLDFHFVGQDRREQMRERSKDEIRNNVTRPIMVD